MNIFDGILRGSHSEMIMTALSALLITAGLTYAMIPILRKKKIGQHIREDGPQAHQKKAGTPSMGGIAIVLGVVITLLITRNINIEVLPVILGFLGFGLIGFLDDSMKLLRGNNLGLRSWQKFTLQLAVAIVFAIWLARLRYGTSVWIPFNGGSIDLGIWYIPFLVFVMVAMANSVNLTDGLDGLASSVTALVALSFAFLPLPAGFGVQLFFIAVFGACIGFLLFNKNPAKIFMGDTGSLALGGGLAVGAIAFNAELLLPVIGVVYVIEVLSVIIQVISFKTTGKRVFKMTPIHHHFEMMNFSEVRIVQLFCIATLIAMWIGGKAL